MAIVKYYNATADLPAYGEIFPSNHVAGTQYDDVVMFLHGIGESGMGSTYKKTIQQCVDFHWFLKKAADAKNIAFIVPQDYAATLWSKDEVTKMAPTARKYSKDGTFTLAGLSMGGLGTLSVWMSSKPVKQFIKCYVPLCPGNYEGLDETKAGTEPCWMFAGAKDAAVKINTIVNTVDDLRRAGSKPYFYLSVYNNLDHYLWDEVMNAIGVPPINPTIGAKQWTETINVNGVPTAVTVQCVNDPSVDVYEFIKMQKIGQPKPLPRLSDAQPTSTPAPTPTNKTVMRVNVTGAGKAGYINVVLQYIDSNGNKTSDLPRLATEVDTVQVSGKTRYTIKNKGVLVMPTFEI